MERLQPFSIAFGHSRLHFALDQMKRACSSFFAAFAAVLFACGCAYFRPSQTEAERLQEQQTIRQDEYLKGTLLDGLVQAAGSSLNSLNH